MSDTLSTLPGILKSSVENFSENKAFSFVGEQAMTYGEVGKAVFSLHLFMEKLGIKQGDKVAIFSTNMPNWPVVYFAVTSMGATVVPILPDFTTEEITNILVHSEATTIFVSDNLAHKLTGIKVEGLKNIINIEDFSLRNGHESSPVFNPSLSSTIDYDVDPEDLAAIIYTSGTTGKSKGVMLLHRNICSNAIAAKQVHAIGDNDRFISLVPLSHTLENTIGMIIPVLSGSAVYYLRKPPTAPVLLPALKEVKPTVMVSVPLIIEKIYYSKIRPTLTANRLLATLYRVAPFRKILHRAAGKQLMQTFGGELHFFGIGGAKLNYDVERFLKEGRFPYSIGYGLTETSPLLAGAAPSETVLGSTGPAVNGVQLKISDPDPKTGEGEIWAKGPNVMKGYFKEPELTKDVLTDDGWFKTGDLGIFNKNNFLFIKGRLKNVIVGASGENIYPEEIESVINNFKHVVESLVVEQKGKIVALVHINKEELETKYQYLKEEMSRVVEEKIEELLSELQTQVNLRINKFSRLNKVVLQPVPFQKTATHKIKRYLYY
ncbi:MAG: AMP-binding protein [Bacteroidales bacterium]|nr:AMP-binding protein [Bacteroidales bacterium]